MGWKRGALWVLGGLLLLSAVAWLGVPPLVKWQAEKQLSQLTGRSVSLGAVSFHPWSLQLTVSDIAVAAAPGAAASEPQFTLASLQVDADVRSLLRLAPVVESLRIDAPRLRLARTADGRYDIDDVLQRLAPRPGAEPGQAPGFALYNVELRGGELTFDDIPIKRQHRLTGLTLALPFVSNLPSLVDVKVEPRLAFVLDGAAYDSAAQGVPFARTRSGTLTLKVAALDLEPYLGYLPQSLPVRLQRGKVSADLALDFVAPEKGEASLAVRGKLGVSEFVVADPGGAPLLALGRASLVLNDVQPLARKIALGAASVDGLELRLARDAAGVDSLQRLLPAPKPAADAASAGPAWQLSLDSFDLDGARVVFNDAAVKPASAWALDGLKLSARQLRLPSKEPMPFSLKATLRSQASASETLALVSLDGQATETSASAKFELSSVALSAIAPYLNAASSVRVGGTAAAGGRFEWEAATPSQAQRIRLAVDGLTLDGLTADESSASGRDRLGRTLSMRRLQLAGVAVDLASQSIAVASAKLQRPALRLERSAQGSWNVMHLAGLTPLAESARPLARAAAQATWQFRLDDLTLDDASVRLVDAMPAPARQGEAPDVVRLTVDKLRLGLQGLRLNGDRLVSTPKVQLAARIASDSEDAAPPGRIEWRGRFGMQPLLVSGAVRVERIPVHAVQAYVPHDLNIRLQRAEAGFQGDVSVQQAATGDARVDLSGDALLANLRLDSRAGATAPATDADRELLSWQSLALNGVRVALRPDALPSIVIREALLNDYFARLVLTEEGRLNLQDVAPISRPAQASAPTGVASSASAPVTPPPARSLPVDLELGGLRLAAGRIDYSDRFVKPNFSAALTELGGTLGAFHTGRGEPATLQLSGRVAGTGLLEIGGKLKPGAVPRELDISAKATDLELAPLSTYAGKYAGYAIERGKLSVQVHYRIEADGKLDASHQVILNQLTFGERVESPSATKLPVLLAVALLKDRNGVIDVDLPVSGTLSDPQFSVGAIILKVIVNLLAKAVTAPFALLAGGGGPDLSVIAFQPGTSRPTADGMATLDKVAKALADRPALKVTLVGEADAEVERDAYQRAVVEERLHAELRREQAAASTAKPATDAMPAITESERARLLETVYRQADLPDKPRNVIGMQATIPPAEMEALLRKHVSVSPEAMRELALQRGLSVRGALTAKGLASDRLFLGAPKLGAATAGDAAWVPQVKLILDTR